MPNNSLSVLYKHIIQMENKNVGLKVRGAQTYHCPPPYVVYMYIYIYINLSILLISLQLNCCIIFIECFSVLTTGLFSFSFF